MTLLRHDPCPRCRKNGNDRRGNNLGVYTDHVYCFACGYSRQAAYSYVAGKRQNNDSVGIQLSKQTGQNIHDRPYLPNDFVLCLPNVALEWVKQYDISDKEILINKLGWSDLGFTVRGQPYKPCLIFPVFDPDGELLMYQARYFGSDKSLPKYVTKGKPQEILHVLGGNTGGTITVVEDLISAIKVSRYSPCMPLWGSFLSNQVATRLARTYSTLNIWLDYDKTKEAHKMQRRLSFLFDKINVISTIKDPKETDGEAISLLLSTVK